MEWKIEPTVGIRDKTPATKTQDTKSLYTISGLLKVILITT
jgi:hypothetical protein